MFILDQSVEEGITHAASETAYHTSNPVLKVNKWEKAMGTAHFRHPMHTWKHQGILISDVNKIIAKHKVAMLECELQDAIRMVHQREAEEHLSFNYIYI